MTEFEMIVLVFLILYVFLLVINYWIFTKYPGKLKEVALGGSILERKGPGFFIVIKATVFWFSCL